MNNVLADSLLLRNFGRVCWIHCERCCRNY